ncbi:MAG: hypothetical protein Q8P57_02315 [Candidatus Pacearchaeota archaeon]|nr:hypothetical protein [Candidatus Pacearchaeota archaeon]
MTNETQEQVEREKSNQGLVCKLLKAGRSIFGTKRDSYEFPSLQSFRFPDRTEETERSLQELFKGTPLYQILEEQQRQCPDYNRRTPLNQFADLVRTDNLDEAFKQIADPVKSSYSYWPKKVLRKEEVRPSDEFRTFLGYYSNDFYDFNSRVPALGSLKLADVSIVTGRLAKKVGKDSGEYYKIASMALNDVSTTMGMAMGLIGPERLGEKLVSDVEKMTNEIAKREMMIGRELGRSY